MHAETNIYILYIYIYVCIYPEGPDVLIYRIYRVRVRSAWAGSAARRTCRGMRKRRERVSEVLASYSTLRLFRYHGCLLPIRCWPLAWCSEWCCVACRWPLRGALRGSPCRVATGGAASGVRKSVLLTSSEGSTGGGPATQTRLMQYRLPRSSGRLCPR